MGDQGFEAPGAKGGRTPGQGGPGSCLIGLGFVGAILGMLLAIFSGVFFWQFTEPKGIFGLGDTVGELQVLGSVDLDGPTEVWIWNAGAEVDDPAAIKVELVAVLGEQRVSAVAVATPERWKKYEQGRVRRRGRIGGGGGGKGPTPTLLVATLTPPAPGTYDLHATVRAYPAGAVASVVLTGSTNVFRSLCWVAYRIGMAGLLLGPFLLLAGFVRRASGGGAKA